MGFCSWLTLILLVAKIFGLLTISWWIVFAPLIIKVLAIVFVIVAAIIAES